MLPSFLHHNMQRIIAGRPPHFIWDTSTGIRVQNINEMIGVAWRWMWKLIRYEYRKNDESDFHYEEDGIESEAFQEDFSMQFEHPDNIKVQIHRFQHTSIGAFPPMTMIGKQLSSYLFIYLFSLTTELAGYMVLDWLQIICTFEDA